MQSGLHDCKYIFHTITILNIVNINISCSYVVSEKNKCIIKKRWDCENLKFLQNTSYPKKPGYHSSINACTVVCVAFISSDPGRHWA